jgi:hypothetical protein
MVSFQSAAQRDLFRVTVEGLERIGYRGLIERDYGFFDYFTNTERVVPLAAFGQSPPSYKTACFGVLLPSTNGPQGQHLVFEEYRSLGAPFHFEVRPDRVALWVVGRDIDGTRIQREFRRGELHTAFHQHVADWSPESVLRAKNIESPQRDPQFDFYDFGLIPALNDLS